MLQMLQRLGIFTIPASIASNNEAKECGVQHLIWSSLYNVTKLTGGKFPNVEHFDSKAEVEQYIRDSGIPATFFMPGFFMSNVPGSMFRQLPPSNDWTIALPIPACTPIPFLDAGDDTGKFVKGILTHRDKVLGKRVLAATDYYTPSDAITIFKDLFPIAGKSANFVQISKDDYKGALAQAGLPEKAQQELYENMAFMNDHGYYGKASLAESHEVHFSFSSLCVSTFVLSEFASADTVPQDPGRKAYDAKRLLCQSQGF